MRKTLFSLFILTVVLLGSTLLFSTLHGTWTTTMELENGRGTLKQKVEFRQDSFFLALTNVTTVLDSVPGSEFTNYLMGKVKIIDDNSFLLKGIFVDSTFSVKLKRDHTVHHRRKIGKAKVICHFTKRGDSFYINEAVVDSDNETGRPSSHIIIVGPFEKVLDE